MYTKILVPLDCSPLAEQAIGRAVAIARASKASIDLVVVHQPHGEIELEESPWTGMRWKAEHDYLETLFAELKSGGGVPVSHALVRGRVVGAICARAREIKADLVVMTSHGRTGFSRLWLGSVADGVLRHSAIPVLMVRPDETKFDRNAIHPATPLPLKKILVTLDGSALAMEALGPASELAKGTGAGVVLFRVVLPVPLIALDSDMSFMYPPMIRDDVATDRLFDEAERHLAGVVTSLAKAGISNVESRVVVAPYVPQAILDFAGTHDVGAIAMSTHGRGMSRLFIGSVADKVIRASDLPLLLCRPTSVHAEPSMIDAASVAEQLPALAGAST